MSAVKRFLDYEIDGIDHKDAPDFVDAYISSATAELENGEMREATEAEIDELNNDGGLVYELVEKHLY
jgi:hypothetical protein